VTRTLRRRSARPGGAVPLARRLLVHDRSRFAITIGGVGFAVALILFLGAVYEGVKQESNAWVATRPVTAWVALDNTTNLIRSSSLLAGWRRDSIAGLAGVARVSPLLRIITTARTPTGPATLFLLGYEPGDEAPAPALVTGRQLEAGREIVLDRAFARQHRLAPGDVMRVQGLLFRVVGICDGTNAVITQFAFVSLGDAQGLLGLGNVVSFFLVTSRPGLPADTLVARVRGAGRRLNVFTQAEFARNNLDELRNGLLPVLATVDAFGAVVGVSILALLLYGTVVERREDFALLKALGAGRVALRRLVLRQAAFAVGAGFAAGLAMHVVFAPLVVRLVPQLPLALSPAVVLSTLGLALAMGLAGAWFPISRLDRVYPAEVFRA